MHAHQPQKNADPRYTAKNARASLLGFIKISSSSGVINARARPWVDASVLKVKSRSHSAQPSVKRRPNPLHSGGKKMQFLIPLKKYNIFLSPIKTSLIEHFKGEAVEARTRANTPTEGCTCTGLH